MRLTRGDLSVELDADGEVVIAELGDVVTVDRDEVRWLQATALPAILAVPPPEPKTSEPSEKVDGQIPGQTSIDEVLDGAAP